MNNNMQDILKNYYASGGKTLFESAEHLDEAPIPSVGNYASDVNKFDKASAEKYPFSTSQKIDMTLSALAGVITAGFAGKGTWDFFDPSSAETMVFTGMASAFAGIVAGVSVAGAISSLDTSKDEVHKARREFSKQQAIELSKQNPQILKDIADFKRSFVNSTPTAIIKQSLELANILYAEGEMQDYFDTSDTRNFTNNPQAEPIMFGSDSDTAKRTKVLINVIGEYVSHYDDLFDKIAEKHNMTDQDLGAYLWYVNGEADLVADWFEVIKKKAGLTIES